MFDSVSAGVFSPREWGCFLNLPPAQRRERVFPTRVGVFLSNALMCSAGREFSPREWGCFSKGNIDVISELSFPHASGGVSTRAPGLLILSLFSPREWGCFCSHLLFLSVEKVFPTRVGVFPCRLVQRRLLLCFPHASGGVSVIQPGRV